MTRKEIEKVYRVENDTIRDPGQFETAHVSTPHFFEVVLNGEGEGTSDPDLDLVEVTDADRAEFGLALEDKFAIVRHDYQGFVDVQFLEVRPG